MSHPHLGNADIKCW